MKSVSRSLAAGKISMPAIAKSTSGKTSVVVNPALTAAFSLSLPGTDAACAAKESTRLPCAAGSSRRSAKVKTRDQRGQQDGALQEERRAVDGDGAHGGDVRLGGAVAAGREADDGGEGGGEGDDGQEHLGVVPGPAGHEGLDQDADDRRADARSGGRELGVLDVSVPGSCRRRAAAAVVHRLWTAVALTWPPPRSGLGSFCCTSDMVCCTAGLTMSVSGFG